MNPVPITAADFSAIGARFLSEDIITEADRLLPLATADIAAIATRGYGPSDLAKLIDLRATLIAEIAGRDRQRGSKKGSRTVETQGIKDGKLVLRSGHALALAALTKREAPPGETEIQTQQIVLDTVGQIDALGGKLGTDSAKVRTRLTSLASILALPALAPSLEDAPARAEFVAKVEAAIAALPTLAEQKKSHQQEAKTGTASLDGLDGRAYTNMKMMTSVGRAYWNEHGDRKRAGEYQLNALHERAAKGGAKGEADGEADGEGEEALASGVPAGEAVKKGSK